MGDASEGNSDHVEKNIVNQEKEMIDGLNMEENSDLINQKLPSSRIKPCRRSKKV